MRLIQIKEVTQITTLSKATTYRYMKRGMFPKSINLGGRAIAWSSEDLELWIQERIQARDAKSK